MAVSLETVVKQLTDSGIIAPGKLENFVPPKANPADGEALLRELYKQNLVTKFQAQQVAAGKVKALVLGNYTILDRIGAGGMGQVFKAEHRRMKRAVALKMLPKAMLKDAAAAARFQREVEAAAKLSHANIVAAHDADESNGVHFLVMEYVEGQDLSALVKKSGPLPVAKAVNYVLQAARGLEFAHAEGVTHRDIKPANLLLDKKGVVKILDMGLARISGDGNSAPQAELTGTGAVMGTVDYMSPEQALNTKHANARADIYSLGCSLYYLLTGKPTYECDTVTAKLIAHQFQPIPSLNKARSEVSGNLEAVFNKMVAKKVEDRYQTMTEVIADLERCQAALSGKALAAGESGAAGESSSTSATINSSSASATEESELTLALGSRRMQAIPAVEAYVEPEKAPGPKLSRPVVIGLVAAALVGAAILAGVIVKMQTKEGTLIVEVDQSDAMVQVLDAEGTVEVSQKGGGGKITIGVDPGKHRLKVEKDGFTVFGQEFELEKGGKREITAKLEPVKKDAVAPEPQFALEFDGKTHYITTPIRYDGSYPITVEAFVVLRETDENTHYIIGDSENGGIHLVLRKGLFDMGYRTVSGPLVVAYSSGVATANRMYHVAGVIENNEVRLFVDGVLQGAASGTNLKVSPVPIAIGTNPPTAFEAFDGWIDEVRISKVARYRGNFTPVRRFTPDADAIALYHFDDGSGDTAHDASAHGNDAKIVGAKWVMGDSLVPWKPGPVASAAVAAQQKKPWNTPAFQAWVKGVAAITPGKQVDAVAEKLKELNPDFDGKIMGTEGRTVPKIENGIVTELAFVSENVTDISPVRALSGLKVLKCSGRNGRRSQLSDLSPLVGMPLTSLDLNTTTVPDLSQLKGMPLTSLVFNTTNISDLSPLKGMKLAMLNCGGTAVFDLSPLAGMPLTKLTCPGTKVFDLSPLAGMPLKELHCSETKVSDLSPLKGLLLTNLNCDHTEIADLSPLKGMKLTFLNIGSAKLSNLSPLEGMPLTDLVCGVTQVTDLSPLKGMPLQRLDLNNTPVSDLMPLKGLPLDKLGLGGSKQVTDLSPLQDCKNLKSLSVTKTKVTPSSVAALQKALPNCKIEWDDPAKTAPTQPAAISPAPPLAKAPYDAAQAKAHQAAWAKHLGLPVETTNSVGAKMVLIPPGEFLMGSTDEQVAAALQQAVNVNADQGTKDRLEKSERPRHRVTITQPFLLGATEVTIGQFRKFVEATKFVSDAERTWRDPTAALTDDSAAASILWSEAEAYCQWLSDREKANYRLPTEAQWEHACRAGTTSQYSSGDGVAELEKVAWFNTNAKDNPTRTVGLKQANPFGLRDMHGNLQEWCQDFYDETWYATTPPSDPKGPAAGANRVMRGGRFASFAPYCRSAFRPSGDPMARSSYVGFRTLRVIDSPATVPAPQAPASAAAGKIATFQDPAFQAWMKTVAAMPADKQVDAVAQKLQTLNPGFNGKMTGLDPRDKPKLVDGAVAELGFATANVTDISPVRALPELKSLRCSDGMLSDLSPLAGMRLTDLNVKGNGKLSDLTPLKDMPLTSLNLFATQVTDLAPLKGMLLTSLDLRDLRKVSDLTPLRGMPLIHLSVYGCTLVTDLSPLQGMPLQTLDLNKALTDLALLRGMPLAILHAECPTVSNLSPLRGMALTELWFGNSQVADLKPLEGMPLTGLVLNGSRQLSDLAPLEKCKPLKTLNVKETKVTAAGVAALQKALPNCKIEWDDPLKGAKTGPAAAAAGAVTPGANASGSPRAVGSPQALRWPLQPSKPEDIQRLFAAQAELTLRTGATAETKVTPGGKLPAGPATVVGVKFTRGPVPTDDALLGFVAGLTDLEDLAFGQGTNPFTTQGLLKLKSLVELRRLSLYDAVDHVAGGSDLLKSLPHLEFIRLPHGTKVAEEWAAAAAARPSITEVSAYRAHISDAGLAILEKMPQLRRLGLVDNDLLTQAAIERCAAALPNCRIEYQAGGAAKVIEPRTPAWNTFAFQLWAKDVAAMPADKQIEAVGKKLMELNPGFDGKMKRLDAPGASTSETGAITGIDFVGDNVSDISPVRALTRLKALQCNASNGVKGKMSDLSPLTGMQLTKLECKNSTVRELSSLAGMPLTELRCSDTQISDLSPLKGMPLKELRVGFTRVSDLSPLQGMALDVLYLDETQVSNVAPLQGMKLTKLVLTPESITQGMDVIRQMTSLKIIGLGFRRQELSVNEFWKKYDAGEFGKPKMPLPDAAGAK